MNERSIAQALLRRIEAHVRRRHASRVRLIALSVGELSSVEPDLLVRAFGELRAQTVCHSAAVEIERVAARWACSSCATEVRRGAVLRCEACGSAATLTHGGDVVLERIELEVAT